MKLSGQFKYFISSKFLKKKNLVKMCFNVGQLNLL